MYWCPVSCPNNSLTQMLMSRCLGALKKSLRTDQCNFQFHSHDQKPEVTEVIWLQYIIISLFSYSLSPLSLSYSCGFLFFVLGFFFVLFFFCGISFCVQVPFEAFLIVLWFIVRASLYSGSSQAPFFI